MKKFAYHQNIFILINQDNYYINFEITDIVTFYLHWKKSEITLDKSTGTFYWSHILLSKHNLC